MAARKPGDLPADDIVVVDEERRAAGFGDQLFGRDAADQQLTVVAAEKYGGIGPVGFMSLPPV